MPPTEITDDTVGLIIIISQGTMVILYGIAIALPDLFMLQRSDILIKIMIVAHDIINHDMNISDTQNTEQIQL